MDTNPLAAIVCLVVMLVLLALLGAQAMSSMRYFLRKIQSEKWPAAIATIARCDVRESGYIGLAKISDRSLFNYTFAANGESYSGQFFIFADTYSAVQLQQELDGQTISIKYNPEDPKISVLASTWDPRYRGREASQSPKWLKDAGDSEVVSLNLKHPAAPKPPNPPQT
jgi:Protein of unknown function (DUF3592)